jgi:hypothetical protein
MTEMPNYTALADDQMAQRLHDLIGLDLASALRAIQSDDPDLGRAWAIAILEARDRHSARKDQLETSRGRIREYA